MAERSKKVEKVDPSNPPLFDSGQWLIPPWRHNIIHLRAVELQERVRALEKSNKVKVTAAELNDMRHRAEIAKYQLQALKEALKKIYNGENDPRSWGGKEESVDRYRLWVFEDQQTARKALGIK